MSNSYTGRTASYTAHIRQGPDMRNSPPRADATGAIVTRYVADATGPGAAINHKSATLETFKRASTLEMACMPQNAQAAG